MIDAIAFKFQTGTQWVHLPKKYGNGRGVHNRLRIWAIDGTWERVFTTLMAQADTEDDLNGAVSADSTIVRAHQHAAGPAERDPVGEPDDHAIGWSRGGLTTKIQWGLRSGDFLPELVGEAAQEVQRLSELGPAVVPGVGGPGAPDPTRESIGEIDGIAGTEQVEG